jgi:hypothetical protein
MLGCELLFSVEKAEQVQRMVEEATGEQCPCKRSAPCPLLPASLKTLFPSLATR